MMVPPLNLFRMAALLGVGQLLLAARPARAAASQPVSAPTNPAPARALASSHPPPPKPVAPWWPARSPVGFFRELLAMNATEREQALTNRTPEVREQILAKVREYEALQPDDRELRLQVTELRWYLRPLMSASATNRPAQLALVPEQHRKLVEDRLQEWDRLSSETQKELLANDATMVYLTEIEGRTPEERRQKLEDIPPARRAMLEQGIDKISSMSEDQRQRMLNRFKEFFELTAQEKQKALNTLSEPERAQIDKALQTFGSLTAAQRALCVRSFEKFAGLSLEERQQFLKSAERWERMSPSERQKWRELVRTVPPHPPPPRPPLPVRPRPTPPVPAVVTNGN